MFSGAFLLRSPDEVQAFGDFLKCGIRIDRHLLEKEPLLFGFNQFQYFVADPVGEPRLLQKAEHFVLQVASNLDRVVPLSHPALLVSNLPKILRGGLALHNVSPRVRILSGLYAPFVFVRYRARRIHSQPC